MYSISTNGICSSCTWCVDRSLRGGGNHYRSSRSSVVVPCVTLLRRASCSGEDAERPERHTHAEHGHDGDLASAYRSSRSSVGMPCVTLRVTTLRRGPCSVEDAERPERHAHADYGHDSDLASAYRSSRSSVGMHWVTLRVTNLRRAPCAGEDAERPERHAHAEHGHDSVSPDTSRVTRSAISLTAIVPHAPAGHEIASGSSTFPLHQAALQQIQPLYFTLYR